MKPPLFPKNIYFVWKPYTFLLGDMTICFLFVDTIGYHLHYGGTGVQNFYTKSDIHCVTPIRYRYIMEGVLGPLDRSIVVDEFTYDQVKGAECLGQGDEDGCWKKKKFLCICIPCYNESLDDLMKTIASLMENIDFMKHKTRFNDDELGYALREDFELLEPVIVPIFDGIGAMHPTVREWLENDMPGVTDGLDGQPSPGRVEVKVHSARWWYYCWDTLRKESDGNSPRNTLDHTSPSETRLSRPSEIRKSAASSLPSNGHDESLLSCASNFNSYIHFQLVAIVKRKNHRKHNSHHWFFQGICAGVGASLVFLTDCGTTYNETCVARLVYALRSRRDLIGVTARQRVATPSPNFHPCEITKIPWLKGEHEGLGSHPCWKCHISYLLSPAPLQGFEFEATLILNSALFNLVEAMPVLPGPCQLLDWPRMRGNKVVEEYFDLLFNEDTVVTGSSVVTDRPLPKGYRNSRRHDGSRSHSSSIISQDTISTQATDTSSFVPPASPVGTPLHPAVEQVLETLEEGVDDEDKNYDSIAVRSSVAAVPPDPTTASSISFTEFLRVNMRLAEDRVLSFVTVFSTGFGTKWIPGATFYYEPEVNFGSLLTQRRRWINGTVASFMYFFSSKRARLRVSGGFFDSHKAGKSLRLVNMLWALNLLQFVFVLVSPSVFAVALYNGLKNGAKFSSLFDWAKYAVVPLGSVGSIDGAGVVVMAYLLAYIVWTANAYRAPRGRIPEEWCVAVVIVGFLAIFPVYFALIASAIAKLNIVHWIVISSVLGPVLIALAQSATSAALYCAYLPWFLSLAVFFLVYVPSYSFARLWDTTWGNRDTSRDDSIDLRREKTMKFYVKCFIVGLVLFNCLLTLGLSIILTTNAQLIFMVILFSPTIIQIAGSIFSYLL